MKIAEHYKKRVFSGFLTGAVNGLFGGGGGMIAVPLLKNMLGYSEKQSHATAIAVIAPICLASAIVYIINGQFDASIIIPAAIGSTAGGFVGAQVLNKLPVAVVNAVFVAVMLAAGIRMII